MAVQNRVPLFVAHLLDDVVPGETGVVDDDVDAAKRIEGRLDDAIAKVRGRHVTDAGGGIAAQGTDFGNHFFGRCLVQVVDDDLGALLGEFQRNAAADATAGTGNDRDFAFKCLFHGYLLLSVQ
ncbi:hypothetical protein D9M71_619800 [compost metagenome]